MIPSDAVATQHQLNVNIYVQLVSFGLLYYDYILTLSMEIERFWSLQSITWASFFFFLNRYVAILGHIPVVLMTFWKPGTNGAEPPICRHFHSYHEFVLVATQFIVGVLLIMRVYALYDRDKRIIWFFCLYAAADVAVGIWSIISSDPISLPMNAFALSAPGCSSQLGTQQGLRMAAAWSGQLIFDFIVFCLTVYKGVMIGRKGQRSVVSTLLRDGAMYFGLMTFANLANILTFIFSQPLTKGVAANTTNIISVTMISRLMLNLRDPALLVNPASTKRSSRGGGRGASTTATGYPMVTTFMDGCVDGYHGESTTQMIDNGGVFDFEDFPSEGVRYSKSTDVDEIELTPRSRDNPLDFDV